MGAVFRETGGGDRSDRAARDRARHRAKLRDVLRDNIADIVSEECIISRDGDHVIKVPIRGIKEYRFKLSEGRSGVGAGGAERGRALGRGDARPCAGGAGDAPGHDGYETEITIDEIVDVISEDLELPDLERKSADQLEIESDAKRRGRRARGPRVHLDRRRTALSRIKRRIGAAADPNERFGFRDQDLAFRRPAPKVERQSNAVVFCMMDTSGSMDRLKKYLARSFFFFIHQFIKRKYEHTDLVFIAHHVTAKQVDEDAFFHRAESGGTKISSAYRKALATIEDHYDPAHWNVYAFHCSDGDNFESDNQATLQLAQDLCKRCKLFGYGEIKPLGTHYYENSMLSIFKEISEPNFQSCLVERRDDIYPALKAFLSKAAVDDDASNEMARAA